MIGRLKLILLNSLVLIAACSSDDNQAPGLSWHSCDDSSNLQCSTLELPMDYATPGSETISLALIRKPAPDATRQGALLFNPGGPGGSGVELIKILDAINTIPENVLAAYDIVGFDPRGVGQSTPVDCSELGLDDRDGYPLTESDVQLLHSETSIFSGACSDKYGDYLLQLGSMNVVRDMDEIRLALGESMLNFIGYSYGTRLAGLYLQQYPETSGRIVLDGSVLPDSSVTTLVAESLPILDSNLRSVLSQCTDCEVDQLMLRLLNRVQALKSNPDVSAQIEFEVIGELVLAAAQDPEFGFFAADTIIEYLQSYDATILEKFIELLEAMGEDFSEEDEDNDTALIAVMCADDPYRPDEDALVAQFRQFNQISDPFAEFGLTLTSLCSGWPDSIEPLQPISTRVAPVSLVIGGTTDAQTPLSWSETMAQAIGGIFVKSEHLGHTAVFTDQSDCLDNMVEAFLIEGTTPAVAECN